MMIREAEKNDLDELLELYLFLREDSVPDVDARLEKIWETIVNDPDHHIIIAIKGNKIVASCVCVIVPNLSRNGKPYALIENVVTHSDYRRKGLGSACLKYAKELAVSSGCYKIMLLTSHKKEKFLNFYKKAGYNSEDKTAFIQWL